MTYVFVHFCRLDHYYHGSVQYGSQLANCFANVCTHVVLEFLLRIDLIRIWLFAGDAEPDLTLHFDADPTFYFDAVPYSAPRQGE
jgi:hypothetical protein